MLRGTTSNESELNN